MIKLSDSELEVMNVIWRKEPVTSNEIIQALNAKNWNKNPIRTFINRLLKKRAIIICKKNGKQYFYKSNINKKEYIQEISNEFVKKWKMLESET